MKNKSGLIKSNRKDLVQVLCKLLCFLNHFLGRARGNSQVREGMINIYIIFSKVNKVGEE
jgi:hypothetical protein